MSTKPNLPIKKRGDKLTADELNKIVDYFTKKLEEDNLPVVSDGKSAYQIAVELGFEGTEEEWLNSLSPNRYFDSNVFTGEGTSQSDKVTIKEGAIGEGMLSEEVREKVNVPVDVLGKVDKDQLYYSTELVTAVSSGYWSSGTPNESTINASPIYSHTNLIPCSDGDKFVMQGMSSVLSAAVLVFGSTGLQVKRMGLSSFGIDGSAYIVTIPFGIDASRFGVNIVNADITTISLKKGAALAEIGGDFLIKEDLISDSIKVTKTSQLINDSGYIGSDSDVLSDAISQELFLRGKAKKEYTVKKWGLIVAGQSNTDGRVPLVNAPDWLDQENPKLSGVKMWNRITQVFSDYELGVNTGASTPSTTLWGYDMVLYKLLKDHLNDDIYVVKRTQGGTAISEFGTNGGGYWNAFTENVPSGAKMIIELEKQIRAAQASSALFQFKALIWHQGEGDSTVGAKDHYYQNFKNVIAYIRGIVDNPQLPVVFGTISTLSAQFAVEVKTAQIKIAAEDPYAFIVDVGSSDLLDLYHFNAASSESLGTSMFNIVKNF